MFHGVPSWPAPGLIQRGADVAGAPGLEAVRSKHADPHHAARVAAPAPGISWSVKCDLQSRGVQCFMVSQAGLLQA